MNGLLSYLRSKRKFDANHYIKQKIIKVNDFFKSNNLDSAVVGLSGGIDSSIVYALLIKAAYTKGSPIKLVKGLSLPIHESNGATNQTTALSYANVLYTKLKDNLIKNGKTTDKIDFEIIPLTQPMKNIVNGYDNAWANGQLASVLRTPILYYNAAKLQVNGYKSIVVGTTNRDEGAYIGFYGKASDGMVDLQPIADIHKSEVYQVAEKLNIPKVIVDATPRGDVYDNKTDEQMIGAPYWFIEMYQLSKDILVNFNTTFEQNHVMHFLEEDREKYVLYKKNVEELHTKNKHKYEVGSPAHYIDVYKR